MQSYLLRHECEHVLLNEFLLAVEVAVDGQEPRKAGVDATGARLKAAVSECVTCTEIVSTKSSLKRILPYSIRIQLG